MDEAAYDVVSLNDFGIGSTYAATDLKGSLNTGNLNGKLFTAMVDFNDSVNDGNQSMILLGGNDTSSETGLRFYEYQNGAMMLSTDRLKTYGGYAKMDWGFGIPSSGKFHLAVTVDYVDFDRDNYMDDVKLSVWIDGNLVHGNFFLQDAVSHLGANLALKAPDTGTGKGFQVSDTAVTEDFGNTAINLAKDASYTVPGTSTTYKKPGEYAVSYKQNGAQYKGNVTLYREGDMTVDNVLNARDLVRSKKNYPILSLSDLTTTFTGGYIPEASEVRGTFDSVTSLVGTAIEFKQIFSAPTETGGSGNIRFGVNDAKSWFGFFLSYDADKKQVKAEYWTPEGTRIVDSYIDGFAIEAGEEHAYRVEITEEGEDVRFTIYIDGAYGSSVLATGQKGKILNHVLAYTGAGSPFSVRDIATDAVLEKSADMDKNGSIEEPEVSEQIRTLLVDEEVEKSLSIGTLSDIHMLGNGQDGKRQSSLMSMLKYYKEKESDVILVNGDVTDEGTANAYQSFVDIVERVYSDVPEESRPKFIITAGNNDYYEGWSWVRTTSTKIDTLKSRFATALGSLNSQLSGTNLNTVETVNGYTFIGVSADSLKYGVAQYSQTTLKWLSSQLKAAAKADPTKPIFVAVAQPPKDTVMGSDVLGTNAYEEILEQYPQVVLVTGQNNAPLKAERSIYQKDYTIVNAGSISHVGGFGDGYSLANNIDTERGHALMIYAKGSKVDFARIDAKTKKTIGTNWTIDDVTDKSAFTYTSDRFTDKTEVPVFNDEVHAYVEWTNGTCLIRTGKATHSEYVYYYEVKGSSGKVWRFVTDFYKVSDAAQVYEFALNGASANEVFEVRAVDAYGNKSAALVAN